MKLYGYTSHTHLLPPVRERKGLGQVRRWPPIAVVLDDLHHLRGDDRYRSLVVVIESYNVKDGSMMARSRSGTSDGHEVGVLKRSTRYKFSFNVSSDLLDSLTALGLSGLESAGNKTFLSQNGPCIYSSSLAKFPSFRVSSVKNTNQFRGKILQCDFKSLEQQIEVHISSRYQVLITRAEGLE
ncbi:hypothetical protein QVD17_30430 [Tagetes erecta]|uniref:Uncharacterized protein n=1 Tax=Tagetes erecta TaxID=13708 RepID=A0AAD8K1I7_TARER|nr:hypothetical protein QVD17_30430 [Tagetes erecta]